MFYFYIVAVFILSVTLARGMENSSCPESKKQYPGDCRLFYKCVPLSKSAHAYVWVPSRCSAGLVFHPTLKECVSSKDPSHCPKGDEYTFGLPYYKDIQELQDDDDVDTSIDDALEVEEFDPITAVSETTETHTTPDVYNSADNALNSLDQDHVPLSAVNNIGMDKIDSQMSILKKLIDNYKTEIEPLEYAAAPESLVHNLISTQSSVVSYTPSNSLELKPNSLPTQLNKITAQLVMQTPIPKKQPTKLNLDDFHVLKETTEDTSDFNPNMYNYTNPQDVVTFLFHKYLTNNNFMSNGEYVREDSVTIPLTSTRKPLVATKQSYNLINQVSREDHLTTQKNRISFFTYSKRTNGFYGKSCLNGIRLPNPNDCTRYFLCNSSTISLRSYTCPPYTAFNKLKRICDAAEYQTCTNEYAENAQIETTQTYNEVHCDTYMCGGLQNFNSSKLTPTDFKCPIDLKFCMKKQKCLPKSLC